jgi:hypothetical protein
LLLQSDDLFLEAGYLLRGYRALLLHCRPFLLGLGRYPVELTAKVDKFPLELLREQLALGLGSDRPA